MFAVAFVSSWTHSCLRTAWAAADRRTATGWIWVVVIGFILVGQHGAADRREHASTGVISARPHSAQETSQKGGTCNASGQSGHAQAVNQLARVVRIAVRH